MTRQFSPFLAWQMAAIYTITLLYHKVCINWENSAWFYPCNGSTALGEKRPLPPGILGGVYALVGGSPIYRIQWDTKEQERQEQIDGLEKALNTLLGITEEADNG